MTEHKCSGHPDAPHGFDRNASHNADRYVCECEGWEPPGTTFDDWFHELENHCLRSERFYDELGMYHGDLERLSKSMCKWLQAAYDMGRKHMKNEAVKTAESFRMKMDADKEHIIIALKDLE